MLELACRVQAIEVVPHAAVPTLAFRVAISNANPNQPIAAISLHCQVQIEAAQRRYGPTEKESLVELFGAAEHGIRAPHALLWTHTNATVPAFDTECSVDLSVACSFDFNAAATKYFGAIETGEVPLALQFSGTVFFREDDGRLQISRIPWTTEARCALPIATWRGMMEHYYPNTTWLCLQRPTFDRLHRFRRRTGLASWEQALERLLDNAEVNADTNASLVERAG